MENGSHLTLVLLANKAPELVEIGIATDAIFAVIILVGFGTKCGLFPMHTWLPDAHSEAPSPVSAVLSAVLLNCAMLVVLRYYILVSQAVGDEYPQTLLLVFGLLSTGIASFFIIMQRDIKRLFAYSSIENMGLISFAFGLGGPIGAFAGLLHTITHSLAKALLFCASGNILLKYRSRDIQQISGLWRTMPFTAVLFAGGALALGACRRSGCLPVNLLLLSQGFMQVKHGSPFYA